MRVRVYLCLFLATLISGCAIFTRPLEKPVQEDNLGPNLFGEPRIGLLSLTPERRIVLSNFTNNRFCAEAPTEVGIDMESALRLTGAVNDLQKGSKEIAGALTAASKNFVLNKRSQGLQLYLSASYTFCQIYLNGGIDNGEYVKAQQHVLDAVIPLIKSELPYIHGQEFGAADSASRIDSKSLNGENKFMEKKGMVESSKISDSK